MDFTSRIKIEKSVYEKTISGEAGPVQYVRHRYPQIFSCSFFSAQFFYAPPSPNFWSLGLSRWGLWIHARASVCVCVRVCVRVSQHIWRSAHQIFSKLCTKLLLGETKKMFQADFWKKFSFAPQGGFCTEKPPFLSQNSWKLVILSYIL